jgi:hypothetical protein
MKSKLAIIPTAMRIGLQVVTERFFIGCHFPLSQKKNTKQGKTLVPICKRIRNTLNYAKLARHASALPAPGCPPGLALFSLIELAGEPYHRP